MDRYYSPRSGEMNLSQFKCLYCNETTDGLSCNDPAHRQRAAAAIAECDAGVPVARTFNPISAHQIVSNRLMEIPIGTDLMEEATWNDS